MTEKEMTEKSRGKKESFAELFEESLGNNKTLIGSVVPGKVVGITKDSAVIDIDLKTEGRVSLREFAMPDREYPYVTVGDIVDVFIENMENKDGELVVSREKARREEAWFELQELHEKGERVTGRIVSRVKGGFTVNLMGAMAFLPRSQVDIRPLRDIDALKDKDQPFQILKMDRTRNNIVISRRAVLEESRAEKRDEIVKNLHEGQILEGLIKNITDYGAFIDLGGVDGLLHITDISWKRLNHPSEMLNIGETIKVMVTRFNAETGRVSLGLKQLEENPWDEVIGDYPVNQKVTGRVTKITDYGAFVELKPGIEGLIHISEISWSRRNVHPGKIVSTSQEVEVMVLDVDSQKKRIALGLKQCTTNPWQDFFDSNKVGDVLEGTVRNVTDFAVFVALPGDIDGMVHMTDLDWANDGKEKLESYKKGDALKVKLLGMEAEKERIALGVKQLAEDPLAEATQNMKPGDLVTGVVSATYEKGVEVLIGNTLPGFIKRSDLAKERAEQRSDRFAKGEKLDAQLISVDKKTGRALLSIKALEAQEQKKAMETYGSADSGAVLGDILGKALKEKKEATPAEPKKTEAKKAEPKKAEAKKVEPKKAEPKKKEKKQPAPAKKAASKKDDQKAEKDDSKKKAKDEAPEEA